MQAIQNIKVGIKNILITTLELAQVRLDMARIELSQLKERLIITLISALILVVCLLIALMSGLFAVNAYITDPQQKFIVFSAICGGGVFIAFILFLVILNSLKKQRTFMQNTLEEVKLDIATLKQLADKSSHSN
ncbi:phage holin family protein [Conservatibacter flavescens]|uniref:Phage holin family protein n=1 Tax=Conservatibacter flavescens TaxID=28161 RepID=A0A2M8S1R1_9PAST|nr:phage holin family protein [Conservatibacter flavescens]PJG85067.1 phage holin family protein [Conservatibacter flavescens]